jgi:tRNA G18 (ribose-2'-O)-methylase SpoU
VATLTLESIPSPDHPQLRPYRSLRRRKDLERQSLFVVEGDKVVQRLLESPYLVESLLITKDWFERIHGLLDRRTDRIHVFLADQKEQIEQITGFACYQGIKAVGRIAQAPNLAQVLSASSQPRLFAALEGISNAENLGVIVRNAAALGVQALIIGETSCSPFLTRAIRTSMGAVFRIPAVENAPLRLTLDQLRENGVRCIAAHPAPSAHPITQLDLRRDTCFVLGSEGFGLSDAALAACDEQAAVPMSREVDSLNVSSAAAVLFYEAQRQRAVKASAL